MKVSAEICCSGVWKKTTDRYCVPTSGPCLLIVVGLCISKKNFTISLFGKGEELRDHVWIEDVVQIVIRILFFKSVGAINVATGKLYSFEKRRGTLQAISKYPYNYKKLDIIAIAIWFVRIG